MEIKKEKLSENLLRCIMEIDNTFYTDSITDFDWYIKKHLGRECVILYDEERPVGYFYIVPIKPELYKAIVSGVLYNDIHINPEMFVEHSEYYYVASCVILKEYRGKGYANKMMKTAFEGLKGHFCAIAVSDGGRALSEKYMVKVKDIPFNVSIYADKDWKNVV